MMSCEPREALRATDDCNKQINQSELDDLVAFVDNRKFFVPVARLL